MATSDSFVFVSQCLCRRQAITWLLLPCPPIQLKAIWQINMASTSISIQFADNKTWRAFFIIAPFLISRLYFRGHIAQLSWTEEDIVSILTQSNRQTTCMRAGCKQIQHLQSIKGRRCAFAQRTKSIVCYCLHWSMQILIQTADFRWELQCLRLCNTAYKHLSFLIHANTSYMYIIYYSPDKLHLKTPY